MVYLLKNHLSKDTLYSIKINDPNVFSFVDGTGKYDKFKVFNLDGIKKKI